MINIIKTEFLKERRSTNLKLIFIVPIIFVIFNMIMVNIIGGSPEGRSYIIATSFNWYPVMILPVVLSLLVVNILGKEKYQHIIFQRSINLSTAKILIAKNVLVVFELLLILLISSSIIYFIGVNILHDEIGIKMIVLATFSLFVTSLPIIGLSFFVYKICSKKIIVILMNFILTFLGAVIAPTSNWQFFPWSYSLRSLSPVIGVHPNGEFLENTASLMNMNTTYFGLFLSGIVYLFITIFVLLIEKRRSRV